jgi:hypothetical protein
MTELARPAIEYVPPRPGVLVVGGREIPVDHVPLTSWATESRQVEIQTDTPDELVIGPRRGAVAKGVWLGVPAFIAGLVPVVLMALFDDVPVWLPVALAGVFLAAAAVIVRASLRGQEWLRFDRRAGRLVCERRVGFSPRRVTGWKLSLEKVVAVQLLHNGFYSYTSTGGGDMPSTTTSQYHGYELNLVLDDPKRRRVHLYSVADWQWVRDTGNRIAAFLGVPVIDKLHHGG